MGMGGDMAIETRVADDFLYICQEGVVEIMIINEFVPRHVVFPWVHS
jgi:hypothetical protein